MCTRMSTHRSSGLSRLVLVAASLAIIGVVAGVFFLLSSLQVSEEVEVHGAFFRRSSMGGGVFFLVHNHGLSEACIVGVEVLEPVGIRAELHRTVIEDNVAKMEMVEKICIPPRGEVRALGVEGDGYHVMLTQRIPENVHAIKVRLVLSSGSTVDFDAKEQTLETTKTTTMEEHMHHD